MAVTNILTLSHLVPVHRHTAPAPVDIHLAPGEILKSPRAPQRATSEPLQMSSSLEPRQQVQQSP